MPDKKLLHGAAESQYIENKWIKAKKVKPEITEIAINPIIKKDTLQNSEFKLKDSLQKF